MNMGLENSTSTSTSTSSTNTNTHSSTASANSPTPTPTPHTQDQVELQTLPQPPQSKQDVIIPIPGTDTGYLSFLEKLHGNWRDCPNLTVTYKDVSYVIKVPVVEQNIRSFLMQGVDKLKKLNPFNDKSHKLMDFVAMAPTTGMIRSGTNTLILAPPGHGKSTFLKALAGRFHNNSHLHGQILYNGLTSAQAIEKGIHMERLCAYVGQTDIHFPVLSVKETMNFVVDSSVANTALLNNPELTELSTKRAELMIAMLGLDECQNTIIGNDLLRGISGGQKKRVTLGEMLVTNARLMCLDEVSTGLDSAVTFHIFNAIRSWTRITNGSAVTALLQPTPETYALFDDVILMKEGVTVYHGPRDQVATWFKEQVGITIPADADEAGWIVDYLTDPIARIKTMQRNAKRASLTLPKPVVKQEQEEEIKRDESFSAVVFHDGEETTTTPHKPTSAHQVHAVSYDHTAVTTEDMYARYQKSPQYEHVKRMHEQHQHEMTSDKSYTLDPTSWSPYTLAQYGSPRAHSYLHHLSLCMSRQRMLTIRNKSVYKPRLFQSVLSGVVYGTLFISLPLGDFQSKMGLMLAMLIASCFANLSELPTASEARAVVTKQIDAGFIPPLAYVASVQICSLPLIIAETLIGGTMLYFIPGFTAEPGRYFFWLFILASTAITLSTFFRVISYIASNPDVARQMDMPFIIIFIIFGGFLIPYGKIHKWLIWLYWFNPLAWSFRSLALNEFNADRYDYPSAPGSVERAGDVFLHDFDLNFENAYKWAGIGYLWGFCLVFIFVSAYALNHVRPVTELGTKRIQAKKEKHTTNKTDEYATRIIEIAPNQIKQDAVVMEPAPQKDFLGDTLPAEVIPSGSFQLAGLPFTPAVLSWRNLRYTVKVGKGKQQHDRVLLQSISGFAAPFTLTALMGASGAGKTTLMDVIAGRKTTGHVEGEIFINGKPKETNSFNHLTGYVEQQDLHMGLATVREALLFSAKLRLPTSVAEQDRLDWVDQVMMLVGLTKLANRLIGDVTSPSLSPGQLKLVTIAVEMVANPSILFLDEPTSGLDAPSAFRVMRAIKRISQTGRSVVCTIHQPSAELFYMFNRLLLLRPGGELVYFADIGEQGEQLVSYFNEVAGPKHPLPALKSGQNPANWMLDVVGAGSANPEGGPGSSDVSFPALDYAALWKSSKLAQQTQVDTEQAYISRALDTNAHQYVSSWVRYSEVQKRYFIMHWRNGPTNLTRIILETIMGLVCGLIYLQLDHSDFQGLQSLISVIFLGISFPASIAAAASFPSFFRQRAVYYRESTVGMYGYKSFSTAMAIVEIPYIFFSLAFFMIPFYFMIGLENNVNLFFKFYLVVYVQALVYSFLSQLWMALFPSIVAANIVNGLFMALFFMFGGLFKKASTIPQGWKWFYYIDPIPKSFIAASMPQLYCDDATSTSCATVIVGGNPTPVNVYGYMSTLIEGSESEYWPMIGWLILTMLVIRILNLLALRFISHIKR